MWEDLHIMTLQCDILKFFEYCIIMSQHPHCPLTMHNITNNNILYLKNYNIYVCAYCIPKYRSVIHIVIISLYGHDHNIMTNLEYSTSL